MYTNSIREAFIGVDSVRVYGYGLGAHTERKTFSVSGVATSSLHALGQGQLEELEIRDIAAVWAELGVKELSLLKLNVEGAEYELLDRLIETDMIKRIKCVQVQFHDFVPNATVMVADLRRRLAKTHAQTYCFDFIWEQWTRLDDISPGQLSAALLERSELEKRLSLGLFQAEAKVRDLSVQILSREDWLDLDDPAKRAEAVRSLSARELVSGLYLKGISLLRRIRGLSRAPKSSKE
jgi:FkbM family methyltransferase